MQTLRHWTLGAKLSLIATPFLLVAVVTIGVLVWMSLQLEGGAASVNEAGRMRMQAYRLVLSVGAADQNALPQQVAEFDRSLAQLRDGDTERPLFVPWDDNVRRRFATIEQDWQRFRARFSAPLPVSATAALGQEAAVFAGHIDDFVAGIESHLSRWTALMHLLQIALMALAIVGAAILLYTGYLFVLEPMGALQQAIQRIQRGDLAHASIVRPPMSLAPWPPASTTWPASCSRCTAAWKTGCAKRPPSWRKNTSGWRACTR